jgi:hypothetical protein
MDNPQVGDIIITKNGMLAKITSIQELGGYVSASVKASLVGPKGDTGTFNSSDLEGYATEQFVNNKLEELIGEAPEALDTLQEIASALGDSDNAISGILETLSHKADESDIPTVNNGEIKFKNGAGT